MKILVINGDCVQVNTSANLCHLAYIRGLVDVGHEVTLLSADGRDYRLDPAMEIPGEVKTVTYYGVSLYEKLSLRKREHIASAPAVPAASGSAPHKKRTIVRRIKDMVLSMYGIHGTYMKFVRRASHFRPKEAYDCVLSLSTPVTSHLLAHRLISSGRAKCGHWIQIWEDPWYSDAYGFNNRQEIFEEEKRLLSFAERICYVSPVTLENQKKLFPESADKMYWQPLPAYYAKKEEQIDNPDPAAFGYFGDYGMPARDLEPFYRAAVSTGVTVNICGNPANRFPSTENIHVHPRMPLNELKPYEDRTGVLVFLCNRAGGQIPGKIYQYSATDKTILFILDGTEAEKQAIRAFFEPFNRYVFCENTVEDIERAIRKIVNGDLASVQNRPLTDFEPQKIVQRILDEGMN